MPHDFLTDPLWYKDAVIYELHVRSFFDANDDGFGEFEGLRRKLPYLESLGVNTLWLLPFLESPLRDDGYDTADYYKVLPVHGDMDDFKAFLDEAHARGMRVITELVLNHTSDQHPWFQEARDPDSPKHDWYVWSDSTDKYQDARIIFTDTEVSNWSWDRKAQRYYWHRFFSHQPDLNYDHPEVRQAMREVLFFWLDLGVDGLRLDAVPYLYEREGTNCENLPETIDFIKEMRAAIEARYGPGKVMLAEANQWPEDTLPYFADGEGVQMAFNFPIMPRMYMALHRENRRPLVEMLELTKDIPEEAQWALFLRNHDELTLEMVTDEERDYMYHEYAADHRFRINVGIRRRLAPLLGSDRRRIELMNALVLSLKGSPILYYGDEIGMGDDPFLGDRNGVRTPMQWSADKHGGFSRAPYHRLFMPPVGKGAYSYEFVNVEDAENNPHSLLQFMKRLITLRNRHTKVFGRGSFRLVPTENQSVLAFLREYEGEQILVVANLSRYPQAAELPVDEGLDGMVPLELFSQAAFPTLKQGGYPVFLGAHGFYWFSLKPQEVLQEEAAHRDEPELEERPAVRLPTLRVKEGLENLLVRTMAQDEAPEKLERRLRRFIHDQAWFLERGEAVERVTLEDGVRLQAKPFPVYLVTVRVDLRDRMERYVLPLAMTYGDDAQTVLTDHRQGAIAWVDAPQGRGLLHDATVDPGFWHLLFNWWRREGKERSLRGTYQTSADEAVRSAVIDEARPFSNKQRNVLAVLDDRYFIKLYRRLDHGVNPELELLQYLSRRGFKFVPKLYGQLTFRRAGHEQTMGILQEAVPVETNGWAHAQEMTGRFLERVAGASLPAESLPAHFSDPVPVWLSEVAPEMLQLAQLLGIRTAELHLALAQAEAPDLRPEQGTTDEMQAFVDRVHREGGDARRMLEAYDGDLGSRPTADDWARGFERLEGLRGIQATRQKIRVHGNYHLGQVIRSDGEFYILDFEGEPGRTLEERRRRDYALRDVASMLRSFDYATLIAWRQHGNGEQTLRAWVEPLVQWCEAVFLDSYTSTAGDVPFLLPEDQRQPLLWAYLLDRALYEVRFEHAQRPGWLWLPTCGVRRLLEQARRIEAAEHLQKA